MPTNNETWLPTREYVLGEAKPIEVEVRHLRGQALTGATATLKIYDSGGTLVASPAMSVTAVGSRANLSAQVTSGGGMNLPSTGDYLAVVTFTLGTLVRIWKIPLLVSAATS